MNPQVQPDAFDQASARISFAEELSADEGVCDGFRLPDQAVAITRDGGPIQLELMELGSTISSNFWVGPADRAEQLFPIFVRSIRQVFQTGCNREDEDSALVALWQEPGSSAALIGFLGGGDWAAQFSNLIAIQYDLEAARFTQIAWDGSDNHPEEMLENLEESCGAVRPDFEKAIRNAVLPGILPEE